MRTLIRWLFLLGLLLSAPVVRAQDYDVALVIVYDTSGSMYGVVRDTEQKPVPKYEVASRALLAITTELERYTTQHKKRMAFGLSIFGPKGGLPVIPPAHFDTQKMRGWLRREVQPKGSTPLGPAIEEAAQALLEIPATSRHVLVLTDGENNIGAAPEAVLPRVLQQAQGAGKKIEFHFVAFDINADVFSGVKKAGATLVSAADEPQLKERLTTILTEKILLEKE